MPTSDMLPSKTLKNWGSSSMLVFLRNLPVLVILGSFFILNIKPCISF